MVFFRLKGTSNNTVDIDIAEQAVEMLQEAQNQVHIVRTLSLLSSFAIVNFRDFSSKPLQQNLVPL